MSKRTKHLYFLTAFGLFSNFSLSSCKTPGSSASQTLSAAASALVPGVQMNDVSILLPLPTSSNDLSQNMLDAGASGTKGVLVPDATFEAVSGTINAPFFGAEPAAGMKMVAMRLDPCFGGIAPLSGGANCQPQLRLVFQSLRYLGTGANATDGGLHALYSLDTGEFQQTVQEIVALRQQNGGTGDLGPLAVHPLIVSQGLGGAFATGLKAIILKHAGASNLVGVAGFIGQLHNHFNWNFASVSVASDGSTTPTNIPTLPSGTQMVQLTGNVATTAANGSVFMRVDMTPPSSDQADNFSALLSTNPSQLTLAQEQPAYDAALRVQNPQKQSILTIDCGSCHVAKVAQSNGEQAFQLSPSSPDALYTPDTSVLPAADLAATTHFDNGVTGGGANMNFHNFSYHGHTAEIARRTINETAAVVVYLNTQNASGS